MVFWNPHQRKPGGAKDFAWMLEVLKNAFWKISTKKIGTNTLEVRFTPNSKWMGSEIVETLSIEAGAKGDKGDKGDKGLKGDKGDKGDQGERGLPGDAVYACGFKTLAKISANLAIPIGRVSHVGDCQANAFLLSVYVECGGATTGSNFQAYNAIIVADKSGVNFVPVSYNCRKYDASGTITPMSTTTTSTTTNEYWLTGICVTFSSVGDLPNSIYLFGPSESYGLKNVAIHWSIMPFMGTAESLEESAVNVSDILSTKEVYYL